MYVCGPPEAYSVPDPAHFSQLIGVEPGRTHPADERLLPVDDPIGGVRKVGRDLFRYEQHAVLVGMEQVAWPNRQSADLHSVADRLQVHVRVRDAGASGEDVEAHASHFLQVADGAVRDGAGAAEGLVDGGLHLTPERAVARRVIEVLHHDHPRRREAPYERPQGRRLIDALPGSPGPNGRRCGVANHHTQFGKHAPDVHPGEAFVPWTDVERLDGIRQSGRVVPSQRLQHTMPQWFLRHGAQAYEDDAG